MKTITRRVIALSAITLFAFAAGCKRHAATTATPDAAAVVSVADAAPPTPTIATEPLHAVVRELREGSAIVLAKEHVFVSDEDAHAVLAMSPDGARVTSTTKLGGRPAQMLVTSDGLLAVALRDEHAVAFYGAASDGALVLRRRVDVSDEPVGLAKAGAANNDVVSVSAISHALCVVRNEDKPARCFDSLARDPRGVTTSDDGKSAIVSHASADGASIVSLDTGAVRVVPLGRPRFEKKLREPKRGVVDDVDFGLGEVRFARFARQAFAAIRLPGERERYAIPHALVSPGDKESIGNGYGSASGSGSTFTFDETMTIFPTVEFDVSSLVGPGLDVETKGQPAGLLIPEVLDHEARCFLPRSAAAVEKSVYVACVGSSNVQRFEVEEYAKAKSARVIKQPARFDVPGGPTAVAVDEKGSLFVYSQHDRSLSVFDDAAKPAPGSETEKATRTVVFDAVPDGGGLSDRVRHGRALFHASRDENISKDRRSCATCHPDGRDDALVWTSPEGFRQTIFLAGRLDRKSPYGWHGKHATIAQHLKVTVRNLGGFGLPDDAIADLEAYIRAIPPPPHNAARALSAEEDAGRKIFASSEARCSTCHAESQGFGGVKAENVSSGTMTDTVKEFLVPSLRYVGGSAPYYHDGRFASLEDLIVAADGKMGHTKQLSPDDVHALASFLKTL